MLKNVEMIDPNNHICRLFIHPSMGHVCKSHSVVRFREYLDVAPFCTREADVLPFKRIRLDLPEPSHWYRLMAVVAHFGMANAV